MSSSSPPNALVDSTKCGDGKCVPPETAPHALPIAPAPQHRREEPHSDPQGHAVVDGRGHHVKSAGECCDACAKHAAKFPRRPRVQWAQRPSSPHYHSSTKASPSQTCWAPPWAAHSRAANHPSHQSPIHTCVVQHSLCIAVLSHTRIRFHSCTGTQSRSVLSPLPPHFFYSPCSHTQGRFSFKGYSGVKLTKARCAAGEPSRPRQCSPLQHSLR